MYLLRRRAIGRAAKASTVRIARTLPGAGLWHEFRTFAGLGIPLNSRLTLETGYMNQSVVAGADRMNHALSIAVNAKF